ncbi:hypothetical protein [Campylobacter hyointestinalis]|uniref:Uncharacterized protein n=1 Tax=Campylobacter hyointestinalis subsp. hyointestinalis TaxID=91352 RepID=A0A9W5ESU7_CAMHY|nr:hypothetical protein [Campylobacter hyointestinalis]PPB71897.1 hypothetical protein CDQ79_07155 [Campylobacter hyointestinalis subsp. hyointestinalis]PPB74788.1 hypothetical protein CDQ80_06550 [Campylobacter hyointestinalis subsp. hyointestinalis]PPB76382.1 hypothetical protein CDQ82_08355 [Campylobacter hyointestinalis subsp. hyointestinalis]PPB76499.1 hypothetical protein CDQ81_07090 [Campylobacter hyointestinalis subsp. hyointestinalis]CUU74262.1 Uncharacterised protein [Campylobacter h
MTNYEKVEHFYKKLHKEFNYIENKFYKYFNIPFNITADTIKRRLVHIVCDGGHNTKLLNKRNFFQSLGLYWICILYFMVISIFGKKFNNIKSDIIYEEWNSIGVHFDKFYKPIYESLNTKTQMIYAITESYDKKFDGNINIIQRTTKINFEKYISKLIYKKSICIYFILFSFSIRNKFDFIGFYLRLLISMAKYETESKNLDVDFLVTAHDNGYDALKYYIYKKNGIKNIISIQNGLRGDNHPEGADMYIYSDFYFSYGAKQSDAMLGLKAKDIIYSGSFPVYFLSQHHKNTDIIYDIVLIEQMSDIDVESVFKISTYQDIIYNLKEFAKKHCNLNVAYRVRKPRNIGEDKYFLPVDSLIKDSNIIFESLQSKDSYEAILKSHIIIGYSSSMIYEAIGLEKKVLICNYDIFSYLPVIDSPVVSLVNTYEEFEKKLLYLLNTDYKKLEKYYYELKSDYMNIGENPINKINNIIYKYNKE